MGILRSNPQFYMDEKNEAGHGYGWLRSVPNWHTDISVVAQADVLGYFDKLLDPELLYRASQCSKRNWNKNPSSQLVDSRIRPETRLFTEPTPVLRHP